MPPSLCNKASTSHLIDTPNDFQLTVATHVDFGQQFRMQHRPFNIVEGVLSQLAHHGVVALVVAVGSLVLLRGLDLGMILLFGLPPVVAGLFTRPRFSRGTRGVAWSFLGAVGIGAVLAQFPQLLPHLGGFDPRLAPWQDRMLTWYAGVYIVWLVLVLPAKFFLGELNAHKRGEAVHVSPFTCYLGLVTLALGSMGVPAVLVLLGFWPLF
jgi:hypothetical protein